MFKNGQVVTHTHLTDLFGVKTLKNTRFIKERNTLVIITDYTKGDHPDKWIGDTLHYTGGHKISGCTNARLADSRTNGITMCLFQILSPGEYTYSGTVKLAGDPYTESQSDGRLAWVFPIKPNLGDQVEKPRSLVFVDMEDYKNRGEQTIRHFVRHRDNYVGYLVRHKEHGIGIVDSFDGTNITVTFDCANTRTYNFDKSFQGGYLQFLD